jgi:polyisoprenoid-binding protein YceI
MLFSPAAAAHLARMLKPAVNLLLAASMVLSGVAAPITFDFRDPKGVNTISFNLDAPLEAISGSANGISGTVTFDPIFPAASHGRLVVAAASLHVPNPTMKEHLHGKDWLNVMNHPEIIFEAESVNNVQTKGNTTTAEVKGRMTIKGVTRELTVPVTFTYLKDRLKERGGPAPKDGDILVLRTSFVVRRSEFKINEGKFEDKVADDIRIQFSLAGFAPR